MKVKQIYIVILLFASLLSINLNAQEIDEIIKKHIDAHGGQENWDAVKSMKITGNYTSFSKTKEFTTYATREGLYRSDFYMDQHKIVAAFDGEVAWSINPWWDFTYPYKMLPAEIYVMKQRTEFCSPFYNYKEKGYQVELLGSENIEGIDCFKIKLVKDGNQEETWFLNKETFLEVKTLGKGEDFGRLWPAEIYYDDFRNVGKLVIPFYRELTYIHRYRVFEYSNVELNVAIDYESLKMPQTVEMQKLNPIVGDWNVKIEAPGRRGWSKIDSVYCNFDFVKNTSFIRGNLEYNNFFTVGKEFNWSYNSSTKRYRLAIFNTFSSNIAIFEGEVTDTLFSFENTNIKFDSAYVENSPVKYVIKNMQEDSFLMELLTSNDAGQTWSPVEKYYFTRKK